MIMNRAIQPFPGGIVKRRLFIVGTLSLAFVVSACDRQPVENVIVVGTGTDIGVLLPVAETSALDGEVNALLYAGLNSARWGEGGVEYFLGDHSLAERWEYNPDSTALSYFLRGDAVWSDGHPIDAADIVFTFELIRRPEIGSAYVEAWAQLDSVIAIGDRQVTFHFQRRYPQMLFDTGIGIIPAHVFEEVATDGATLTGHATILEPGGQLVVSGPYRVAEWRPGERLLLEANPLSFAPSPATDSIVFRVVPEEVTMLAELETGGLDVVAPVSMSDATRLEADERFRVETMDDRFYDYLAWNLEETALFGDAEVRRALSLAIDRQTIIDGLSIGRFARPAAGPYPPIFGELVAPSVIPDSYLPDSATAILAARGWADSDGDGVLDKDGRAFSFTLLTQAGNERRTSAAEIIQARYAEIGIEVNITALDFGTLLGLMFDERDFEAVLLGWQVALEPSYLGAFFWPPDHPFNFTGYASAELDSLIPLAQSAATAEDAAPYWREAARVIAVDRPYAFLWYFDDVAALREGITNTRIDTYGLFQNLHEWRLRP
jgi:peptide/nickel transport system substrate-binding protein